MVGAEIDAPEGRERGCGSWRRSNGQFSQEESAPLQTGMDDRTTAVQADQGALKPDAPATMTSRFEPKDTAAAFSALDRLAKTPDAHMLGGTVELNGGRSEGDFLTLRLGRDVPLAAADLDALVKELVAMLYAPSADGEIAASTALHFPRDATSLASAMRSGEDFDRVEWKQD